MIMDSKLRDNIKLSTTISHLLVCRTWVGVANVIVYIEFLDYVHLAFAKYLYLVLQSQIEIL